MSTKSTKSETVLTSLTYVLIGLCIGGVIFYLTPLKHISIIKPLPSKVKPEVFYELYKKAPEEYLLIDIRSVEFRALEFPERSIHIPLNELAGEIDALPRNKKIVIFCESNFSATAAYHVLQNNGFLNLQIMDQGRQGWKDANLPLVQTSDKQKEIANQIIELKSALTKLLR